MRGAEGSGAASASAAATVASVAGEPGVRGRAVDPRGGEGSGAASARAGASVSHVPEVRRRFGWGATRAGQRHRRAGRNNQDGWAVTARPGRVVGVVTDGCGSRASSELGAQLGAHFLAGHLAGAPWGTELPSVATDALCRFLARVATELDASAPYAVVDRSFLFSFVAVVMEGRRALVFGAGDGAVVVDGAVRRIDPGPDNAPEYCAYRLQRGDGPEPIVHFDGEAAVVAVMTDGFDSLLAQAPRTVSALYEGAAGWEGPFALERRLNVLGEAERLADDATLVVVGGE